MSDKSTRAGQYAQAVVAAMLERWQSALEQAGAALKKDDKLAALVGDASKGVAERAAALESALPQGTEVEIKNLLKTLLQQGELDLLGEVSSALAQVGSGRAEPLKAEIASAVELSADEQEQMRQALIKQYGEGLSFSFRVDEALLGGLRVRVGDRLIDTSVASRLSALRESLISVVR
jgi:F-type H+-transporting ATPase subunit delta